MKPIAVGILDDQLEEVGLLKEVLETHPRFTLIGEVSSPHELPSFIRQNPIDLLFSDIQMPGLNGFTLLKQLNHRPKIVFVSSYPKYAVDSFSLQPLFFLTKPLQEEKIQECLSIAQDHFDGISNEEAYIFVRVNQLRAFQKVYLKEILYIQSAGEYQQIFLQDGSNLLTYKRMKEFIQELPQACFVKVHRSYAVNMHHIQEVLSDTVKMSSEEFIPVSRSNRQKLLKALKNFNP